MILYTVYNCDDQITGISNYIPTNLPSACRVEPINLDNASAAWTTERNTVPNPSQWTSKPSKEPS